MAEREHMAGDLDVATDEIAEARTGAWNTTRKVAVGVAGGTMVVAGLISMPLPLVPGLPIVLGGLAVLSTEFEGVRRKRDELTDRVRTAVQRRR
jgi:hypothetical protein